MIYLNAHQKFYNLFTTWKLLQVLRWERPDIVQSSQFDANVHARVAARWLRVPVVIIEEHGIYRWKRWYHRWIDRALSRWTDAVIAVSESVVAWVARQGVPAEKIVVLYNCVDIDRFVPVGWSSPGKPGAPLRRPSTRPAARDSLGIDPEQGPPASAGGCVEWSKAELRHRHGYASDDLLIGTVGTLRREKGHGHLLEAMRMVVSRYPSARLLVVGDGPLRSRLEWQAVALGLRGRVEFLGTRTNVPELLGLLDLFVLASVNESFGIALAEAMCVGLPCVATAVGGIPEVLGQDYCNHSFPVSRLLSPAPALQGCHRRPWPRTAARERASRYFSVEVYLRRLAMLYQQLLGSRTNVVSEPLLSNEALLKEG